MALSFTGCGDFYLEDAFLPPTCDEVFYPNPERVLNVTEQDVEENHKSKEYGLMATTHSRTTRSSTTTRGMSHHRSPEAQLSFQLLSRTHMNRFNKRLSMLESNTLDMKESLETMKKQHGTFISQLKMIARVLSPADSKDRVDELAKKYTNIETRLGKLEHKLEILIDGFTTLAQEIDKVKRERRISRPPHHREKAPGIAPTTIPALTTTREKHTSTGRSQRRTLSPTKTPTNSRLKEDSQSIRNTSKQVSRKTIQPNQAIKSRRKDIVATPKTDNKQHNKSLKRATVPKTNHSITLDSWNGSLITSNSSSETPHSQHKRKKASGRVPRVLQNNYQNATSEKRHDSVAKETKFQIPPPAHTSSKPHKEVHIPSKKSHKPKAPVIMPVKQNTSILLTRMPSLSVQKTPNKTRLSRTNLSDLPSHEDGGTGIESNQPEKEFNYTTPSNKPANQTTRSSKPKGRITTRRKSAQKNFNILDIFMQNNKGQKRPRIKQDGTLHIVLGRIAIPVKILPDY